MLEWLEANPLQEACVDCTEQECYNCEDAGMRWYLSSEDELKVRRKMLVSAIERLQRQLTAIDEELEMIGAKLC